MGRLLWLPCGVFFGTLLFWGNCLGVIAAPSPKTESLPNAQLLTKAQLLQQQLGSSLGQQRISILAQLVDVYRNEAPKRALLYGEEALRLLAEGEMPHTRIRIFNEMSWAARLLGDYPQAILLAESGLSLARQMADVLGQARALNNLGIVYRFFGDHHIALKHWLTALELRQDAGDKNGEAGSLNNIGLVYLDLKEPDKSISYFERALELSRENENTEFMINHLGNLGEVYMFRGQLDKAQDYFQQALSVARSANSDKGRLGTYLELGDLALLRGRFQEATAWGERGQQLASQRGDQSKSVATGLLLAKIYYQQKLYDQSLQQLEPAIALAQALNEKISLKKLYLLLADVQQGRGAHNAAFTALKQGSSLSQELSDRLRRHKVAQLQSSHEAKQHHQQLELLKKENSINRLELEYAGSQRLVLLAGLSVVGIFAIFLTVSYRVKIKAKHIIEQQYTELEQIRQELQRQVVTDPLTGVLNRRGFQQRLDVELARANRDGSCLSLCFIDADNFKVINDRYGHDGGDRVLVALAQLLLQQLRAHDVVVRWGGEEFLVVLSDTDYEVVSLICHRINKAVAELALEVDSQSVSLTVTIGFSIYQSKYTVFDDVMKAADEALYEGKGGGRNQVVGKDIRSSQHIQD